MEARYMIQYVLDNAIRQDGYYNAKGPIDAIAKWADTHGYWYDEEGSFGNCSVVHFEKKGRMYDIVAVAIRVRM